jgi:hypothetical protein
MRIRTRLVNDSASSNGVNYSTVLGIQRTSNVSKASTPDKNETANNLGTIIEESLEREIFVRMQKNLILLKLLGDSCSKAALSIPNRTGKDPRAQIPSREECIMVQQSIAQVKAAERRISAIVSPLVYQLYPEQIEAITLYMADAAMACAESQDIPMALLDEIELPRAQEEFSLESNKERDRGKTWIQDSTISRGGGGVKDREQSAKLLPSREHCLFVASVYLSETVEQLDKLFREKVEKLTRLIRPDIASIEIACSRINKICTRENKWAWSSDFKTF